MMKVLVVHNKYRTSAPSGEDGAVQNEMQMLAARGVDVVPFERCNDDLDDSSALSRAAIAVNTVWSGRSRSELTALLKKVRPDIAHVHNTFSMISPSIYGACRAARVPVVQTLHNFRFFCPGALFLRDGKPCEDCVNHSLWRAVRHRCYRGSIAATTTLASMLALHRALGTYSRDIDRYIALTDFARRKIANAGISNEKISVKANFIPHPPSAGTGGGGYALFVGRLLEGKGTETLLKAWQELPDIPLKIVGDGALRQRLVTIAQQTRLNVEFTGQLPRDRVLDAIGRAEALIVPSEWYEGFPMVVAESFACGTPIIASRIGSLDELVRDGETGIKFPAGDAVTLAHTVRRLFSAPDELRKMRLAARAFFDANLTENENFNQLLRIYHKVLAQNHKASEA